jgi:hypothetical protein
VRDAAVFAEDLCAARGIELKFTAPEAARAGSTRGPKIYPLFRRA